MKCLDLLKNVFYSNDMFWLQCKCVSMNNQECKIRPEIINGNNNK